MYSLRVSCSILWHTLLCQSIRPVLSEGLVPEQHVLAMQVVFDPIIMLSNAAAAFGLNMSVFLLIGKVQTLLHTRALSFAVVARHARCLHGGLFIIAADGCCVLLPLLHHCMRADCPRCGAVAADVGADDEHRGRGQGLAAHRPLSASVPVAHQPRQPGRLLHRLRLGAAVSLTFAFALVKICRRSHLVCLECWGAATQVCRRGVSQQLAFQESDSRMFACCLTPAALVMVT